jgi:hypothetical protein
MFKIPPVKVRYAYGAWQPMFEDLKKIGVEFHLGLPTQEDLDSWCELGAHQLLIIDDCMQSAANSSNILDLFSIRCHHENISSCHLVQNLFFQGRCSRSISLNAHYQILFKCKRDKLQIQTLGKQILPGQSRFFMESYEDATEELYGYLLCDLHPATSKEFQLRTHIFPGELPWHYTPRELNKNSAEPESKSFSL